MMKKRCGICGQQFYTIKSLLLHHEAYHTLDAVQFQVEIGKRNDWRMPDNPTGFQLPTHIEFMTSGEWTTHADFTWRAQLPALLASLNVELEG